MPVNLHRVNHLLPRPRRQGETFLLEHPDDLYLKGSGDPVVILKGPINLLLSAEHDPGRGGELSWVPAEGVGNLLKAGIDLALGKEDYMAMRLPAEPDPDIPPIVISWPSPHLIVIGITEDLVRPLYGPLLYELSYHVEEENEFWSYRDLQTGRTGIFAILRGEANHTQEDQTIQGDQLEKEFFGRQ